MADNTMAVRLAVASLTLLALVTGSLLCRGGSPSPDDALPLALAAQTSFETERQIRLFETRVREDPVDFLAYNDLAQAFLQRARETGDVADLERAEVALARSLSALPGDNPTACLLLAAVKVAKHRFAEALEWAQRAQSLGASEGAVYALAGDALMGLGRYDEATNAYERLREYPDMAALARLAHLHELRGDVEAAWDLLERSLRHRAASAESTAWLRWQRGNLQFLAGRATEAEAEYYQALQAFPGYLHALAGLARVRASRGDYPGAAALYRRVITRVPLPEYVLELGDVLVALGRHGEAKQQFDLVRAIDRLYQANGVDTDLQMALFAADHEADLSEWTIRAQALYERRPTIYAADALAWTLHRAGQTGEALLHAREALRWGTRAPLLLFHAGAIAASAGEVDEARGYLEATVALQPQFSVRYASEAQRLLRALRHAGIGGR